MNIALLLNHARVGGITQYARVLAKKLITKGHTCVVAAGKGTWQETFAREGIPFYPIASDTKCEFNPRLLFAYTQLNTLIRKHRIEILHAQTRTTQVLAAACARANKIPYVSTAHGFYTRRFSRRVLPLWGKRVIAVSGAVREHLIRDFKVPKDKAALIYNGIELGTSFKARVRAHPQEELVIGSMARLSPVKGQDILIEAFAQVVARYPRARLVIAGEGEYKKFLEKKVAQFSLDARVAFIGNVGEPSAFFDALDVFAMPSRNEGLGLAILEAMAHGVPVVAASCGGIVEFVKHDETGLLCMPQDPRALAHALLALLGDEARAMMLARNAHAMVQEKFSADTMATHTLSLYAQCIKKS